MSAHFYITCGLKWRSVRKTRVSEPCSLVCQFDFKTVKIHHILQLVKIRANLIAIAGRMVLLKTSIYTGVLRLYGIWVQ
jgi:hypothetical protein